MKTLVVYYSRSGTTKKIADEICDKMNCDIEEIIDNKNRKGLFGWLIAAFDARSKKLTVIENIKNDPSKYDLVIMGTPIWAGLMAPALRTYINQNKNQFKKVAFFCTHGGSGELKTFKDIEDSTGIKPISKLGISAKDLQTGYEDKLKEFILEINKI